MGRDKATHHITHSRLLTIDLSPLTKKQSNKKGQRMLPFFNL